MSAAPHLRLVQNLVDDNGELVGYCRCGCGGKTSIATRNDTRRGDVKGQPRKYLFGHRSRINGPDYVEEDRGHTTLCWVWQKSIKDHGYGYTTVAGKLRGAHVVYYERLVGPVPDGLILDHLCRVRACVNPAHLEPVTYAVNNQRGARSKLTEAEVRRIRRLAAVGASHTDLAEQFGVAKSTVGHVVTGRTWKDVA